jgi:hypothetical protein
MNIAHFKHPANTIPTPALPLKGRGARVTTP